MFILVKQQIYLSPMLQYPPPGDILPNYFPETSELSSEFSSLQLLNSESQILQAYDSNVASSCC